MALFPSSCYFSGSSVLVMWAVTFVYMTHHYMVCFFFWLTLCGSWCPTPCFCSHYLLKLWIGDMCGRRSCHSLMNHWLEQHLLCKTQLWNPHYFPSGCLCFTILIEEYRTTVCSLLVWSVTQSCRLSDRGAGPSGRPISRGTTLPGFKPQPPPTNPSCSCTPPPAFAFLCSTHWLNPPHGDLGPSSTPLRHDPARINATSPPWRYRQGKWRH